MATAVEVTDPVRNSMSPDFPLLLFLAAVIAVIVVAVIKNLAGAGRNSGLPVVAVPARVVTKRTETTGLVTGDTGGGVRTWYYATFELDSGERMEFSLGGAEYGMLAEGDRGELRHQGTRYHGFDRKRE
jgi:hypothetical protein